jgi:hypothetical protein
MVFTIYRVDHLSQTYTDVTITLRAITCSNHRVKTCIISTSMHWWTLDTFIIQYISTCHLLTAMNYQNTSPWSPPNDCFWVANIQNNSKNMKRYHSLVVEIRISFFETWTSVADWCSHSIEKVFISFTYSQCADFFLCGLNYRSDRTLLTLQGQWGLSSSYCPGRRAFKFIVY